MNASKQFFSIGSINYDSYQLGRDIRTFLGGSACNVAHFLSELLNLAEYKVNLVGLIGTDENGQKIKEDLEKQKIILDLVKQMEGTTGSTVICLDDQCERTITRLNSVTNKLADYLKETEIQTIIGHNPLYVKGSREVIASLFTFTRDLLSVDISGIVWNITPNDFQEWFHHFFTNRSIEILFGNEEEFSALGFMLGFTKTKDEFLQAPASNQYEIIRKCMKKTNSKIVGLKRGKNGGAVITMDEFFERKAFNVKVIDTTGAGDAYNAGFLYRYLESASFQNCLDFAVALGGLKVSVLGAQNLDITTERVESFIKSFNFN